MQIARFDNLILDVLDSAWYSFFNSPYIGHRTGTAVDVYFPDDALFPLERGKVVKIRKVRAPKHLPYETDYLIVVDVGSGYCLKSLHVRPSVNVGDSVVLGDSLGEMIVSGFFMPWSDRHAHFEIRGCEDSVRARGGMILTPIIQDTVPSVVGNEFMVAERGRHYAWLKPLKTGDSGMTPLKYGDAAVEGGLPHYRVGAVFSSVNELNIFGVDVSVESRIGNVGIFSTNFRIFASGAQVQGIGVYCNQPMIKLIGGRFEVGEVVELDAGRGQS